MGKVHYLISYATFFGLWENGIQPEAHKAVATFKV